MNFKSKIMKAANIVRSDEALKRSEEKDRSGNLGFNI